MTGGRAAFRAVVLDVDSTLCGLEGVDWLARRRGPALADEVAALTTRAMAGELALDAVYGRRLARIRPSAVEVAALADAYRECLAPGAAAVLARLRAAGVALHLVSGGLREAILPLARSLDFAPAEVHAVGVRFDEAGAYAGFDEGSPLTTQEGKRAVIGALGLAAPVLAVGDGATDLAMRPVVAAVAAFTGFIRRDAVVRAADLELPSFDDLLRLVLP
ncbi:MAG TPA: HAD-IB family phosphatase [Gemmatimonadales bacterium]|nr:HAD-IB family phosphatase [Gemmatimonadales bacterium]